MSENVISKNYYPEYIISRNNLETNPMVLTTYIFA